MDINLAKIALGFVIAAEYIFTGSKRGAERKEWVIQQLYSQMPDFITQKLDKNDFGNAVEAAVVEMKKLLENAAG